MSLGDRTSKCTFLCRVQWEHVSMLAHAFIINRYVYRAEMGLHGWVLYFPGWASWNCWGIFKFSRDIIIINRLSTIIFFRALFHISREALDVSRHGPKVVRDRKSCRQITPWWDCLHCGSNHPMLGTKAPWRSRSNHLPAEPGLSYQVIRSSQNQFRNKDPANHRLARTAQQRVILISCSNHSYI